MAVIGGFRSDLSITLKTDGNFGNVSGVFCSPKSCIKENGGKRPLCRLHSMSRDGMSKDGRKMSPMYVTPKAGIMRSQGQDCKYILV